MNLVLFFFSFKINWLNFWRGVFLSIQEQDGSNYFTPAFVSFSELANAVKCFCPLTSKIVKN
jgi:hypothetical protein